MNYNSVLLVSESYIKTFTNANDNISSDYLLPAIFFSQRQYLEECIGSSLTKKLQYLVATDEINNDENINYKILLDEYVQDFLAFTTLSEVIITTAFKINNLGVVVTDDEKSNNVSFDDVFKISKFYKNKSDYLMYRLQRYLIANYSKYPELSKYKTVDDLRHNLYSAANTNIWLGGERGRKIL